MRPDIKVGVGYDSHRFVRNRNLVLGGVIIPHEMGLEGHSDADVLLHAIADALLGAIGKGDIGRLFSPNDDEYKDIKSTILLSRVFELVVKDGFRVGNIDAVIIAEQPKMAPHIPVMQGKIAKILLVPKNDISIKATSNEKMGFIGRNEGIAVIANILIYKDNGTVTTTDK